MLQDSHELMTEKEALQSMINSLKDEIELSESDCAVLVTPRYDVTLTLLISALNSHNLVNDFLSIVHGVGDMEMLAASKQIQFKSSGLTAYHDFYKEHKLQFRRQLDFNTPQNVPKVMFMILEHLLGGQPTFENFHKFYVRPTVSAYSNKLLYNSQILEVRENYHRITVLTKVRIKV